jgi:hypothetical protein
MFVNIFLIVHLQAFNNWVAFSNQVITEILGNSNELIKLNKYLE